MMCLLKRMYVVLSFACTALVSCLEVCDFIEEFKDFKEKYNKTYDNLVDESKAYQAFEDNLRYINLINILQKEGKLNYSLGINEFTDMKSNDFADILNGCNVLGDTANKTEMFELTLRDPPPDNFDWRTELAVTQVKNQFRCGACYAFVATGAIEGQLAIRTGNLLPLSEQNIIDCGTPYGTKGCKSGNIRNAFKYVIANKGIATEDSYPYEARDGPCRYNTSVKGAFISAYKNLKRRDEEILKKAVYAIGPIATVIDGNHKSFKQYKSGILYEPDCLDDSPTHGVLIVGFGVENGQEYWLVKNSWGTNWGEHGYIRMARNRGNNCGIASYPVFPLLH